MTEIGDMVQSPITETRVMESEGLAQDIRALADLVELYPQHFDVWQSMFTHTLSHFSFDREQYVGWAQDMARELTRQANATNRNGGVDKIYVGNSAGVRGFMGQLALTVWADRNEVCTKVVKGTKTVQVPDPNAPMVDKEIDDVEWVCDGRLLDVTRGQDEVSP